MQQEITETLEPGWLFDTYADGVYTLAYRITRDRHLAEDVVQETIVNVIRSTRDSTSLQGTDPPLSRSPVGPAAV